MSRISCRAVTPKGFKAGTEEECAEKGHVNLYGKYQASQKTLKKYNLYLDESEEKIMTRENILELKMSQLQTFNTKKLKRIREICNVHILKSKGQIIKSNQKQKDVLEGNIDKFRAIKANIDKLLHGQKKHIDNDSKKQIVEKHEKMYKQLDGLFVKLHQATKLEEKKQLKQKIHKLSTEIAELEIEYPQYLESEEDKEYKRVQKEKEKKKTSKNRNTKPAVSIKQNMLSGGNSGYENPEYYCEN